MVSRSERKLTGQRNQCPSCGELFNSNYAFSKHRFGPMVDRQCLSVEGMQSEGMLKNHAGFWISSARDLPNAD